MKVSDAGPSGKTRGVAKKKRAEGGHGAEFAERLRSASGAVANADSADPTVIGVEGILAVQEAGSATHGRSKGLAFAHGGALLDRLDELRRDILLGVIPKDRLVDLARSLRDAPKSSNDPRLDKILAEIEMRVEIEIAKYTR